MDEISLQYSHVSAQPPAYIKAPRHAGGEASSPWRRLGVRHCYKTHPVCVDSKVHVCSVIAKHIRLQPILHRLAVAGWNLAFQLPAAGKTALEWRWQHNDGAIPGETSSPWWRLVTGLLACRSRAHGWE